MAKRKLQTRSTFPKGQGQTPGDQAERSRILDAAEDRFRRFGFQRVPMDELAEELGMSKKTIYKHFPSKESLVTQIARITMRRTEARVSAIVQSERPFLEKLVEVLQVVGVQYARFSSVIKWDLSRYMPTVWKEIETFRRHMAMTKIVPMLQQAKAEGVLRPGISPEMFFLVLLTTIEGILNPQTLANQPFTTEEAFQGIFRILFQGVLTDEAAARFSSGFSSITVSDSMRSL
jgi:AcrR family transcriptional regulator